MHLLHRAWFSLTCLILAVVMCVLWLQASGSSDSTPLPVVSDSASPLPEPPSHYLSDELSEEEQQNIAVYEQASPSVVFITSVAFQRDFFSLNLLEIPAGTGSGFIWDDEGHIVTNFHVIREGNAAQVTLADQSTWNAELVGAEPDKDLAVLKIKAPKEVLKPLSVGKSANLHVGQNVFAIGNPFGLDQTLTTGVISGVGREIRGVTGRTIRGVIQTDAAINPGNSGGPLLNSSGRLIGINTAIYSPSGAYAGVGFAVPVDVVRWMVPQIIEHGQVIKPSLPIELASDSLLRRLGVEGVLVLDVESDSDAARAGLRPTTRDRVGRLMLGDLITAINGQPVKDSDDLFIILEDYNIGDTVEVTVRNQDGERKLRIPLTASAEI